jgi:hypothetical protein
VLISLAAVATAWCGYQSARWGSLQALDYSRSNAARIEASIAANRSNAIRMVDVGLFLQYESAIFRQDDAFAAFIRKRFPTQLAKAVDAWLATNPLHNVKAPPSPFAMNEYRVASDVRYESMSKRADDLVAGAVRANETSDQYLFVTVLFASVTFLGGIAIKTRYPLNIALTLVAAVLFFVSLARVLEYPVR